MALEQNHCTFVAEIGGVVRDLKQTTPDDQESQVIDRQPLVFRQPVTLAVLILRRFFPLRPFTLPRRSPSVFALAIRSHSAFNRFVGVRPFRPRRVCG